MTRADVAPVTTRPKAPAPAGYVQASALPLTSLIFVLPLVIFYEVGTRLWVDPAGGGQRIIAFNLMHDFFALFGASGQHLPALAVVGILLAWHIARNDAWSVSPAVLFSMILESIALAVPVVAIGFLSVRYLPLAMTNESTAFLENLILSCGAGVYEELVFRLMAFGLLSLLLVDFLGLSKGKAGFLIMVIGAVAFSAYHYLGSEVFNWRSFAFRTAAGVYFGAVYLTRGFGVTAGSHAAYDIIIATLRFAG